MDKSSHEEPKRNLRVSKSPSNSSDSSQDTPVNGVLGAHAILTRETFDTSGLNDYYKPISSYEGIHRFDPTFEWEAKEEQRVVRKV